MKPMPAAPRSVNWTSQWSPSRDQLDKLEMLAAKYRCTVDEAFDRAIGLMLEFERDDVLVKLGDDDKQMSEWNHEDD